MSYKRKRYTPPPEPPRLTLEERWALTIPTIVAERSEARIGLASLRRELLLAKLDPMGQIKALEAEMKAEATEAEEQRAAHAEALVQVQQRLGIEAFTFDPETGVVTVEAVSAKKKE
jgi:hypothetical protein